MNTKRFIEIDVSESANCPMSVQLIFNGLEEPRQVSRVKAAGPDGTDALWEITGWSSGGSCPAYAALIEESGEGTGMLIFGGDEGVRFKPLGSTEPWSLDDPSQWGEACLVLRADVELE